MPKDAKGHGSNPGEHSAGITKLPKLGKAHFQVIAQHLFGQKPQDPNDAKANASFSDRISAAADKLEMTNPGFNRTRFIEAAVGKKNPKSPPRSAKRVGEALKLIGKGHF